MFGSVLLTRRWMIEASKLDATADCLVWLDGPAIRADRLSLQLLHCRGSELSVFRRNSSLATATAETAM